MVDKQPSSSESLDEIREQMHRQMLDAVSHDLKTPLATIIGSLEIYGRMNDKLTREKKTILMNTALTEAYRLDNFITNILDMAKLEAERVQVRAEKCQLMHLINDCLTRLGPRRDRCTINLNPPSSNLTVYVDPMLLARALTLVLENAAKHGGRNPVIDIDYGIEDTEGYIRVRDHGPGIPPGKEEEIFLKYARFARADHQNAGTGLGLAICRLVVNLINGRIEVKNHPQGGAIFTLRFPCK